MLSFVQRFASHIIGILSGFDRLRFRGTKRLLANVRGMMALLWQEQVRLSAFTDYVQAATDTVRAAIVRQAQDQGRPLLYLNNARQSAGNKPDGHLYCATQSTSEAPSYAHRTIVTKRLR